MPGCEEEMSMSASSQFDFLYDIERVDFCAEGLHYLPCVRYGRDNPRQYMDCIYQDGLDHYPVLIWVHGGGWSDEYNLPTYRPEPTLLELAKKGWFIACIEYRLAWHSPFPTCMEDCQKAVAWLREHKDKYRLESDHFAIWGESAGAHLSCLVGANYNNMENAQVQSVVAWFCPSDMNAELEKMTEFGVDQSLDKMFGPDPKLWEEKPKVASPLTYASSPMPRVLLMHGDVDTLVSHDQSVRYLAALKEAGNDAELVTVPGQGHGFFKGQQYYDKIVSFLEELRQK